LRNAEKLRESLQLRPAPVGVAEIIGGLAADMSVIASDLMVIFKSAHRARI
jgi:hypothetical protein